MNERELLKTAFGVHADAMQLRAQRAEVLGANIANADTPGYLAKDMDFAAALREAGGSGPLESSHAAHYTSASAPVGQHLYREPTHAAADGNTVDPHLEKTAFADNAVAYQVEVEFLNSRIRGLLSAIRGE